MPRVDSKKFFATQKAHSRVKAEIVYKYVMAWLNVMLSSKHTTSPSAAYVDLFSGPGSYEDGSSSTPLLIMGAVLKRALFKEHLRTYFNDEVPSLTESLKQEIEALPHATDLHYRPVYTSRPVSIALVDSYGLSVDTPQFYFLDQFGWADIKPDLIKRIFRSRKCDCVFFLRTSRFIAAVPNAKATEAMQSVFGQERLTRLRQLFLTPGMNKEALVLKELESMMKSCGVVHFLAFPFRVYEKNSSKHHLIYLGKHERGLSIMKDIMARQSSPHFRSAAKLGVSEVQQTPSLFSTDPIAELEDSIMRAFRGRTLTVGQVYSNHHPGTNYVFSNYQEALRRLEQNDAIVTQPVAADRIQRGGKVTMSESVVIHFPPGRDRK